MRPGDRARRAVRRRGAGRLRLGIPTPLAETLGVLLAAIEEAETRLGQSVSSVAASASTSSSRSQTACGGSSPAATTTVRCSEPSSISIVVVPPSTAASAFDTTSSSATWRTNVCSAVADRREEVATGADLAVLLDGELVVLHRRQHVVAEEPARHLDRDLHNS